MVDFDFLKLVLEEDEKEIADLMEDEGFKVLENVIFEI